MTSVCNGCVHEQACGRADVHECANRAPAVWCSCDQLRKAEARVEILVSLKVEREAEVMRLEAERDRYKAKALEGECWARCGGGDCPMACCDHENGVYCNEVIGRVG